MEEYLKQVNEVKNGEFHVFKRLTNFEFENELKNALIHLSQNDKILSKTIKIVGQCRLKQHKKYFETLVDAIISQQLSIKVAEKIFNRFKLLFDSDNKKKFPSPNQIIDMDDKKLRSCGLSNAKVAYIKDLTSKVLDGTVKIHRLGSLTDEEIINELIQVKGIGVWTAHMFLIFCLGRLNVLPAGDFGFKNAVKQNYNLRKFPTEKKIIEISKKNSWSPYQSVAAWYMWQSLSLRS